MNDQVLVKLQPYRQNSVRHQPYSKLSRHFYGPFVVLESIGLVAYHLQLPPHSRIHPVIHVSLLKQFRQNNSFHHALLPSDALDNHPIVNPIAILQSRQILHNNNMETQVLVQCEGLPMEDSSWLLLSDFQKSFPNFHL